jgi:hypothetical protein
MAESFDYELNAYLRRQDREEEAEEEGFDSEEDYDDWLESRKEDEQD